MAEEIRALLVHDNPETFRALRPALESQAVRTVRARNCREIARLLKSPNPPQLIFTEAQLPDGTWQDIVRLVEGSGSPINVIVVSRLVDVGLYIEVIERGAFDFIAPPFEPAALHHIVRCAASDALSRRQPRA